MFAKTMQLELLCVMNIIPLCQVQKASHPLFKYCAGPDGLSRVDVSTFPGFLSGQLRLSWPAGTPWPWLEQNPPFAHIFTMAYCSVAFRFLIFACCCCLGCGRCQGCGQNYWNRDGVLTPAGAS